MAKPLASVSLDLDNKWSYLKTHGDPDWESYPSYLDLVVPRFLEFLDARNLKITVFVVGQDAALEKNQAALKMIADAGHEIGNHSFHHEPWLHLYSSDQIESEFERSEEAILAATGQRPIGFRGPGFSLSQETLQQLARRGYQYDASTFPTFLGPVARAYYFFRSKLSSEQREERKALFGKFADGFQPIKPFLWKMAEGDLLEIPVTTMPFFKLPIHLSYLLYLGQYAPWLSRLYFWKAITLCRWTGVAPSLLLHPLDFMGGDDDSDLSFFPAMSMPSTKKIEIVSRALATMTKRFQVVPMAEYAEEASTRHKSRRSIDVVRAATA